MFGFEFEVFLFFFFSLLIHLQLAPGLRSRCEATKPLNGSDGRLQSREASPRPGSPESSELKKKKKKIEEKEKEKHTGKKNGRGGGEFVFDVNFALWFKNCALKA